MKLGCHLVSTTRLRRIAVWHVALFVGAVALDAAAHHSFVGFYDQARTVEVEGVVTSLSWRNPHGSMTIEVEDDAGRVVEWQIETGSVSVLRVRGLDRDFIEIGDRIRVAGEPSLKSETGLYARNVLLANGTEALLSIGVQPRWTDPDTGRLLDPRFDRAAADAARRSADGIFRVWATVFEDPDSFPMFKGGYPLTAQAQEEKAAWDASDVVQLGCAPKGMPSLMITPYPIEFSRRGDDIVIRFEEDDAERVIHMRPNAARPPGFRDLLGYSVGHWEDGTLVVETDGVSAEYFDSEGTPQSPGARFVERFAMSEDATRLDYSITVSDPETFTESFELRRYFVWRPELRVNPYECVVRE